MKFKRYISGKLLVRLGLFLVLLAGAWLFDEFHEGKPVQMEESQTSGSDRTGEFLTYFCTPQSPVSLKVPVQKAGPDKFSREKFDRLIREQLSARSQFLHKAEVFRQPNSCLALRNLISFRYHFLCHPDDQSPVA